MAAVIAAILGCWEVERMFLGHQLPTFSANTALLDFTSCFLSPSLPLRTHFLSVSFLLSYHMLLYVVSRCLSAATGKWTGSSITALLLCLIVFMSKRGKWHSSKSETLGHEEGRTEETKAVEYFLWVWPWCHQDNALIIQLGERCDYSVRQLI